MAPTVLRQDGYRFMIFPNDHPPAHVHVLQAGREARYTLAPVAMQNNWGFSVRDLRRISSIIEDNRSLLLAEWDRYHDER